MTSEARTYEGRTYELRCRECGKSWGNQPRSICDDCFSPLEVFYDYDAVRSSFTRERIAQGPASMWRYSRSAAAAAGLSAHCSSRVSPHCLRRHAWLVSWARSTFI